MDHIIGFFVRVPNECQIRPLHNLTSFGVLVPDYDYSLRFWLLQVVVYKFV